MELFDLGRHGHVIPCHAFRMITKHPIGRWQHDWWIFSLFSCGQLEDFNGFDTTQIIPGCFHYFHPSILLMKSPYISLCIIIIRESSTISQNHRLRPKTLTGNAFDLSLSGGIGSPKIWRPAQKMMYRRVIIYVHRAKIVQHQRSWA